MRKKSREREEGRSNCLFTIFSSLYFRCERCPYCSAAVQQVDGGGIGEREIDLRGVCRIDGQVAEIPANMRQRFPGMASIGAAEDGQAGFAINDLGLCERGGKPGIGSLIDKLKCLTIVL